MGSTTIWGRLDECVQLLTEPFGAHEIIDWFRRHYPDVKEQSLRAHIQGATSNASEESRGAFVNRSPLITRVDRGVYRRYDGRRASPPLRPPMAARPRPAEELDIRSAVGQYLGARGPDERYASFDYCFNHFQQYRAAVAEWGGPNGLEVSCLQLGFYLASWGMLRGSSELLQRSLHHLIPTVKAIAAAPAEVWDLDLDAYDAEGISLVLLVADELRRACLPVRASDILVSKVMLGVFGCVPAFDTYFKSGFGVSTFSARSLRLLGQFYRSNSDVIDELRTPTLGFATGGPTELLYTRAKVVDMAFFIKGGYPRGEPGLS